MAITITNLTANHSNTDAASYNTASISPTAGRLVLVAVTNLISTNTVATPTVTGASTTWTQVVTKAIPAGNRRVTILKGIAAGTGALTIDFGGETQLACAWNVVEFSNASDVVQSASAGFDTTSATTISVTLSSFADAENAVFGVMHKSGSNNISPGTGFTEVDERTIDFSIFETEWKNSADTSVDWTWTSESVAACAAAVEIQIVRGGARTYWFM